MKPIRIIAYAFAAVLVLLMSVSVLVNTPPGVGLDNMPRLGVDADYNFSVSAVSAAHRSGVALVRSHISWTTIEAANTDPSHYSWTYYDSVFSRLASNNLSPIAVIDKCPAWACPFYRGPINAANMTDYTEFVNTVVARYSRPPYNIHYWELFDEPDGTAGPSGQWNYGNHAAEYVQALRVLYTAVKQADSESVVMNGGLAYDYPTAFRPEFVGEMLANGGAQYMDALNFHYFRINGPGWTTIKQKADELRGIMRNEGVSLPLVCTSVGDSSENISPWYSSEAQQARYVVRVNVQSAAADIKSTTWYLAQDFDCVPVSSCPPGWEVWARHGLARQDGTDKLAMSAMKVLAQEMGSGAYVRQLGQEAGVTGSLEGYQFGGSSAGSPQISVVWNNTAVTSTLTMPVLPASNLIRALSMTGQVLPTTPGSNGTVMVSVGPDPVYLEWSSSRFVDVPVGSTFYPYIEPLAKTGVVSGFVDGTFRPNNPAYRGHLVKMVVLANAWPIDTKGGPHFTDVTPLSPFYVYVETAFNREVIGGYTDGTFRPYSTLTRGQLCKILAIAQGWGQSHPAAPTFTDVPLTHSFYGYVEAAVAHSVISGYSDGTFRPDNQATRGQATKVLYNAISVP